MHNRLKNTDNTRKHSLVIPPQVFTLLGGIWITLLILLLVHTNVMDIVIDTLLGAGFCQTCTAKSLITIVFQISMFFIGGLGISYGIVHATKSIPNESQRSQLTRIVLFALGVSIASLVVYSWAYLFTNGL